MPGIIKKFRDWITGKEDFKVYFSKLNPNSRFRRAGKDKKGNIIWQSQSEKGGVWSVVTDKKVISDLTNQYRRNLAKKEIGEIVPKNINSQDYWTLITVIACENFLDNLQGMADVAQSIYNRFNIPNKAYGKSITQVVLATNQYEPVTIGLRKGAAWKSIKSKKTAIIVYAKTKGVGKEEATKAIDNAINAQKNVTMIKEARKWVQTRTEFLADVPTGKDAVGVRQREPKDTNNTFFWNYQGKSHFWFGKILSATQIPDTVNMA
jgi:hypothetical protein